MDLYYFDASVLVKAYIWEVGTEDVRQVLRDARAAMPTARILTSRIAFARQCLPSLAESLRSNSHAVRQSKPPGGFKPTLRDRWRRTLSWMPAVR